MISFNVQIRDFPFNENSQGLIENWKNGKREYGSNWPVVYLIHNDDTKEAYVGETLNAGKRAAQHWQVSERQRLNRAWCFTTILTAAPTIMRIPTVKRLPKSIVRFPERLPLGRSMNPPMPISSAASAVQHPCGRTGDHDTSRSDCHAHGRDPAACSCRFFRRL